jgi:hypothetical protein
MFSGMALALGRPAMAAGPETMSPQQRLETMVRLRGDLGGGMVVGWLDAVRSTVIDGDIKPLCRMKAVTLSRFVRRGDLFEATLLELAYYLDPASGAMLRTVRMPGADHDVAVPPYRTGPTQARFGIDFDEWEEVNPGKAGQTSAAFAPKAAVHLERNVGVPTVDGGALYLRTDEYGRVYPDRAKPPTVFYREWMIWRADAHAVLSTRLGNVPAEFSYTALSSWRPWMEMGETRGHTAENGRGRKTASLDDVPEDIRALVRARDPDVLANPARALG